MHAYVGASETLYDNWSPHCLCGLPMFFPLFWHLCQDAGHFRLSGLYNVRVRGMVPRSTSFTITTPISHAIYVQHVRR